MQSIETYFIAHSYLIGCISFLIGLLCMPMVIEVAKKKHLVVRPNKRMSHTGEIPNVGGIDICISFVLTCLLFGFNAIEHNQFFIIGIFIILIVGLVDDLLVLSPLAKLFGELLAGIALIGFADIRITHLHGIFGIEEIGLIPSYLLSGLILVAIINAINLIDGVDGLASGLGMLYCLFFAVFFGMVGEMKWSIVAISLIGSLAVFFCYNVFGKKQKIFMGDSGSLLLGYMLTTFVFRFMEMNAYRTLPEAFEFASAPAAAICILTVPIFDTIRVSLTRIKNHRSPFEPDKNHIHHLLLRTGLNHIQTTCVLLTTSVVFIALAIIGKGWNFWVLLTVDFALATALTKGLWWIINKKQAKE